MGYKNEFEFAQLLVAYNSDGRAACSTISPGTTAFRWEQNTQMEKSENVIKNKISIISKFLAQDNDFPAF